MKIQYHISHNVWIDGFLQSLLTKIFLPAQSIYWIYRWAVTTPFPLQWKVLWMIKNLNCIVSKNLGRFKGIRASLETGKSSLGADVYEGEYVHHQLTPCFFHKFSSIYNTARKQWKQTVLYVHQGCETETLHYQTNRDSHHMAGSGVLTDLEQTHSNFPPGMG